MLFSCWQKDTTTRPYRPYRAVLLFSNTKRRVILRMRSDAFQSACDAASTKNKRMATQTNAVKSLSDEVDFSLSGSKCTVSARFLHGFKTCKGCKSLQNRTKSAETRISKPAIIRKEMALKRNFQKLRESPGVRYESVGRGFESLPSHQTMKICVIKRRWAAFCAIGSETAGSYNLRKTFNDLCAFFNADDPAIQRNMIVGSIAPLHIRVETVISSAALILLL